MPLIIPFLLLLALGASTPQAAPPAPASPHLRLLIDPSTQWGWARDSGSDSAQRRTLAVRSAELSFYRELGFTHVSYGLDPDIFNRFGKVAGRWEYQSDGKTGADSSLAAAKRAAEKRGLQVVPHVQSLSHMEAFIAWVDSTVSEFPSRKAFKAFCAAKGLPDNPYLNHIAATGNNPAAAQLFAGQLGMIRRAWGKEPPAYILIGHDELGYDSVCFIKAGKMRKDPRTRSELVAAEIAERAGQVAAILGDSTRILLYGDSFLPTDLGERYGLSGQAGTGKGGVLWLLRHRHRLERKIIVIPWNYILEDGETHYWSRYKYDRKTQLRLLERLGFGFVPGAGEHGSSGNADQKRLAAPFALGMRDKAARCVLEWVSAARKHPSSLRGYAHQVFEPYDFCGPDGLCAGFTAPLLAYAGWIHPGSDSAAGVLPPRKLLDRVDHIRSRREGKWVAGVHYPGP